MATPLLRTLIADEIRFLTFRPVGPAIRTHRGSYLAFGLLFTWLAGIGRYWDNPKADLWQHLGLGSVAYVFVLALIIWALLAPLRPKSWSFRNVLLFIVLTSPPAVLYAIPVETFMSPGAARAANSWFLALVASWRVALFGVFLRRTAGLSRDAVVIATLLPLAIIVIALAFLNLEHVVFNIMSGTRPEDRSSNDGAYAVVFMLTTFSILAAPFLIGGYLLAIYRAWRPMASAPRSGELR